MARPAPEALRAEAPLVLGPALEGGALPLRNGLDGHAGDIEAHTHESAQGKREGRHVGGQGDGDPRPGEERRRTEREEQERVTRIHDSVIRAYGRRRGGGEGFLRERELPVDLLGGAADAHEEEQEGRGRESG